MDTTSILIMKGIFFCWRPVRTDFHDCPEDGWITIGLPSLTEIFKMKDISYPCKKYLHSEFCFCKKLGVKFCHSCRSILMYFVLQRHRTTTTMWMLFAWMLAIVSVSTLYICIYHCIWTIGSEQWSSIEKGWRVDTCLYRNYFYWVTMCF